MLAETIEIPPWAFQVAIWSAGVGAVITALIKLVPRFRELWINVRQMFRSIDEEALAKIELNASLKAIRRVNAIKNVLDQWVKRYGAQRCMLLAGNNGGEAWNGKGPLYVSNPAQSVGPGNKNTWSQWQGWRADAWHTSWLHHLLETFASRRGYLLIREVDVEGDLKVAYTDQGTVASVVLPFKWLHGSVLWYVAINFGRTVKDKQIDRDEEMQFVTSAREIYDAPARCRALIDELKGAFNSVR